MNKFIDKMKSMITSIVFDLLKCLYKHKEKENIKFTNEGLGFLKSLSSLRSVVVEHSAIMYPTSTIGVKRGTIPLFKSQFASLILS
jgi:hypothetical protein